MNFQLSFVLPVLCLLPLVASTTVPDYTVGIEYSAPVRATAELHTESMGSEESLLYDSTDVRYLAEETSTEISLEDADNERSLGKKKQPEIIVAAPVKKAAPVMAVATKMPVQTKYAAPTKKWRRLSALSESSEVQPSSVQLEEDSLQAVSQSAAESEMVPAQSVEDSSEQAFSQGSESAEASHIPEETQNTEGEDDRDLGHRKSMYVVPT
ncbi:hypothetical protein CSUI_001474, partial [Cystoisospora suis]